MLSHINLGAAADVTIRALAESVARVTGFRGRITFNITGPDGAPRKLMDVSRLAGMGWTAQIGLDQDRREIYQWFLKNTETLRG